MNSLLFALQFLTVIPIKIRGELTKKHYANSLFFFPLTGLVIGLLLFSSYYFLSSILALPCIIVAILLVALQTLLTGGLHLDGLADTADAWFSHKTPSEMLTIMRDSHIGTMGTLALIIVISLKIVLLSQILPGNIFSALLIMNFVSRYILVMGMTLFTYLRPAGKASLFVNNLNPQVFRTASLLTISLIILLIGTKGLLVFAGSICVSWLMYKRIATKLGGITGDTLGAVSEIAEVAILLFML